MKRNTLNLLVTCLGMAFFQISCGSNATEKKNEHKADSLEQETQRKMDSVNEANLKKINAMPDSDIVNDTNAPEAP
jgi:hypothetical protein